MEMKKNIVDFRGPRRKTKHKTPREKFEIFSEIRLPKLLNSMKSVKNLANKRYYEYTEKEKKIILKLVQESYSEMMRAWKDAGKKSAKIKKKSFWDSVNGNS